MTAPQLDTVCRLSDEPADDALESPPSAARSAHRHTQAADLRVLLITQGTYPFRFGGVATWCRNLIRGLPSVDFHILALVADPDLTPLFLNCGRKTSSALTTVPLWGVRDALETRKQLRLADLRRARRVSDEQSLADGLGRPLRELVTAIFSAAADPFALAHQVNARRVLPPPRLRCLNALGDRLGGLRDRGARRDLSAAARGGAGMATPRSGRLMS